MGMMKARIVCGAPTQTMFGRNRTPLLRNDLVDVWLDNLFDFRIILVGTDVDM